MSDSLKKDIFLDEEWVELITYALNAGMSAKEIREFFEKQREKQRDGSSAS
ncbi:anti-repressor SinI family protein [Metabacillus malikii]|uniref:DNA-binding transcriptional MerR regulator n=1 Tax=Metabacillus malikii TaxID=1504265 RepID=A0ABT9ZN48_9BACI|nr:anti-repressor SinI family protein [Metabacillus malikii]MDQ0233430.1 DNA-binding transcriptional MerR regulator [Metabacillus malikii]